ncbi:MAG: hypothetical protein AAF591_00240 [Verrucomicrobiota bacterium]
MNLKAELRAEHSKAQTMRIVGWIGGSSKRFGELAAIVTGEEPLLAQRGAWAVSHCAESNPTVVRDSLLDLLEHLRRPDLHDAIKRNVMKAVSIGELDEDSAGLAADIAFELLGSPDEAVATKVYSMSVLQQVCEMEPELVQELKMHIEQQLPLTKKPAFHSRARHVLRALDELGAESLG